MKLITRKSEIKIELEKCIKAYRTDSVQGCVAEVHSRILSHKVKFPLLEYCAHELFELLLVEDHIPFCDSVESLKTEGGNVILGIMLQRGLLFHFQQSIVKATEYIGKADIWYVCDIIGERVFGFSLLNEPNKTILEFERLSKSDNNWVIRSLGAGGHYAIKKGLDRRHVKTVFKILLSMANNNNDKEIRQGVGWAAKTTAKFHPDVIQLYAKEINNADSIATWFRTKVKIGLERHEYAKGDRG